MRDRVDKHMHKRGRLAGENRVPADEADLREKTAPVEPADGDQPKAKKTKTKKTLKSKLILIVLLVGLLQIGFMTSGYVLVYGNLTERAGQRVDEAFDATLQYVTDVGEYAAGLSQILPSRISFSTLTYSNYQTNTAVVNAELINLKNVLYLLGADSRFYEVTVVIPDETIAVSSRNLIATGANAAATSACQLCRSYTVDTNGLLVRLPGDSGDTFHYLIRMERVTGLYSNVYLVLTLTSDYFVTLTNVDTIETESTVIVFQDRTPLYSTNGVSIDYDAVCDWAAEHAGRSGTMVLNDVHYFAQCKSDVGSSITAVYLIPRAQHYSEIYRFLTISVVSLLLNIGLWIFFVRSLIFKTVYGPVMDLVNSFEKIEDNNFDTIQKEFDEREWDEVTRVFNSMVRRIREYISESYQKDLLVKNMELKFLQSQINPHFLYNTLDSIAYKANSGEIVDVNRITGYLSRMYRLIFNKGNDFLSVAKVLECCEMYLRICEFKYSNFGFKVECAEDVADIEILNLIVQTVSENAVVHHRPTLPRRHPRFPAGGQTGHRGHRQRQGH